MTQLQRPHGRASWRERLRSCCDFRICGAALLALAAVQLLLLRLHSASAPLAAFTLSSLFYPTYKAPSASASLPPISSSIPLDWKRIDIETQQQPLSVDTLAHSNAIQACSVANRALSFGPIVVSLFDLLCDSLPLLHNHSELQQQQHLFFSCCDFPLPMHIPEGAVDQGHPFPVPTFSDQFFLPSEERRKREDDQQQHGSAARNRTLAELVTINRAVLTLPTKSRGLWLKTKAEEEQEGKQLDEAEREGDEGKKQNKDKRLRTHFEVMRQQLLEEGYSTPWSERSNLPFWKGQLPFKKTLPYYQETPDHPRSHLVRLSKHRPQCVHARFSPVPNTLAARSASLPEDLEDMVEAQSPVRYADHKYLVHVGNVGYADRLWQLLLSGSTVLWMQDGWQEWWYPYLQPFVHFVPVGMDAADLCEKVAWLQAHPREAERIANNGRELVSQLLTWENIEASNKRQRLHDPCVVQQPPSRGTSSWIVQKSAEKLRAAGATQVLLFGSAVWSARPRDIDLVVRGLDENHRFRLWLELEGEFGCLIQLLAAEHIKSQTLWESITNIDVTKGNVSLPAMPYTQAQFSHELRSFARKKVTELSRDESVFTTHNKNKRWKLFVQILHWCRKRFKWNCPVGDESEEPDRENHHALLVMMFKSVLSPGVIDKLNHLREQRNNYSYDDVILAGRLTESEMQQLLEDFLTELELFVGQCLALRRWLPPPPEGVPQPIREKLNAQAAKMNKQFNQRLTAKQAEIDVLKKQLAEALAVPQQQNKSGEGEAKAEGEQEIEEEEKETEEEQLNESEKETEPEETARDEEANQQEGEEEEEGKEEHGRYEEKESKGDSTGVQQQASLQEKTVGEEQATTPFIPVGIELPNDLLEFVLQHPDVWTFLLEMDERIWQDQFVICLRLVVDHEDETLRDRFTQNFKAHCASPSEHISWACYQFAGLIWTHHLFITQHIRQKPRQQHLKKKKNKKNKKTGRKRNKGGRKK
ncbi:Protein O-glucosyltransferase 1 [Balamuthia mandrillaris]